MPLPRSPFAIAVSVAAVALAAAFAPVVWTLLSGPPPRDPAQATTGAPWEITLATDGRTRVFGLTLRGTTLAEARDRWGDDLALAVISGSRAVRPAPTGADTPPMSLEGYVERFASGGIAGRLLLTFEADAAALDRWSTATPGEPTESGARRHALRGVALAEAASATLVGISFIPAAQLDAAVVAARFGPPAERQRENARLEHWLYPSVGLAVALDAEGKEVLQYVAPADFERRLAAPLRARPDAAGAPAAGASPGAAR